jgi:hypothetical protein
MRKSKIASVAFTGVAAAGATMAAVPAAFAADGTAATGTAAAGTWHVNPPGPVSASATSGTTLVDDTTGITLTCPIAHASGSLSNGSVTSTPPWTKLGTISASATFGTTARPCTIGGVQNFTAHLNKPLDLSAKSYNTATGVTMGRIHGSVSASLTGVGNTCTAKIVGIANPGTSIPVTYTNGTNTLSVNEPPLTVKSDLHIQSVAPTCIGIHNSDMAHFTARYHVNSPNPLTISKG